MAYIMLFVVLPAGIILVVLGHKQARRDKRANRSARTLAKVAQRVKTKK